MRNLDNANLYFVGTLQLQEGVVRMVKKISLEDIRTRFNETRNSIQPIYSNPNLCAMESNYSCIRNAPSIIFKK